MTAIENAGVGPKGRHIAAVLAVLVAAFCLSSVAPAASPDLGCQGLEASPKMCAQPGASDPLPEVVQDVRPLQWTGAPAARLPRTPLPRPVFQTHAGPSAPRAPPFSLD